MPRKTKEQTEKLEKEQAKKNTAKKATAKKTTTKKSTSKTGASKKVETTKKTSTKATATKKTSTPVKKTTTKKATSTKKSTTTSKKANSKSTAKTKKSVKKAIPIVEYYDLPYRYNQTIVKLLAQTPTNLFVYWDISDEDRENYKKTYGENFFEETKPVLIIHNNTLNYSFEVEIN
ncbi:MAG: hypothetical protein IKF38_01225, partial [Clostridia bacterium]|nr:hypothetical protein [Clostridia bacterium]